MKLKSLIFVGLLIFSIALWVTPEYSFSATEVNVSITKAVLSQDWQGVAELLRSVSTQTESPVLRLLKAHACLNLNRNNESLCLFLSVRQVDLDIWNNWTENLLCQHPKWAIAHYLRGDALARLGKWEAALNAFNNALKFSPQNALILDARGIVYAVEGELRKARIDFYNSGKETNFTFADPYCNLGFLNIQKKDMAEAAERYFTKALDISPDFALALHGRGLIRLIVKRKDAKKDAKKDLELGFEKATCNIMKDLMLHNEARYAACASNLDISKLMAEAKNPGTAFSKRFNDLAVSANRWGNLTSNLRKLNWLPFNKHLANLTGNRYVERLETIKREFGDKGLDRYYNNNPLKNLSLNEICRVGQRNKRILPTLRRAQFGLSIATVIGGRIAPESPIVAVGKIGSAIVGLAKDSSNIHATFKDNVMRRYGKPFSSYSTPNPNRSGNPPGGVSIDLSKTIDEGKWPFKAYYGLVYGLESEDVLLRPKAH